MKALLYLVSLVLISSCKTGSHGNTELVIQSDIVKNRNIIIDELEDGGLTLEYLRNFETVKEVSEFIYSKRGWGGGLILMAPDGRNYRCRVDSGDVEIFLED